MITTYIDKIKNAILGKDVKNAIADALECAYGDAVNGGNVAAEVSLARGSYVSLGERIDAEEAAVGLLSDAIEGFGIVLSTDETTDIADDQILVVYAE